jgi:flagella synthesis protein FlgN
MSRALHQEMESALGAVVEDMRLATTQLEAVLEAEREALAGADATALDSIGERKQQLMQQLEQLDVERLQLIQNAPLASSVEPVWQQVVRTLQSCRDLNQRNGLLVGQRLGQVRRALAVLTGRNGDTGVYGPSGELHPALQSHRLAQV